jgi:hypothetical protein
MPAQRHRVVVGAVTAAVAIVIAFVLAPVARADTATVPITTFAVSQDQCAGGVQPQSIQSLQSAVQGLLGPRSALPIPILSPDPGCTPPSSSLNGLIAAANAVSSSPNGAATVSSQALGNALLPQRAYADVELLGRIPLSAPATSVDVSIPYTTAGVSWSSAGTNDLAGAEMAVGPGFALPTRTDGSYGSMAPYDQTGTDFVFPFGTQEPPGAGTYDRIRFYCRSGAQLASGLEFRVIVISSVVAASGQTETATADFRVHDVIATIHS